MLRPAQATRTSLLRAQRVDCVSEHRRAVPRGRKLHCRRVPAPGGEAPCRVPDSRAFFDAANRLAQRIDFSFGVELGIVGGIVIIRSSSVTRPSHSDNVAGRKMHQPGVIALSEKPSKLIAESTLEETASRKSGLKSVKAGAVHDEIERFASRLASLHRAPGRQAHVPSNHFHFF